MYLVYTLPTGQQGQDLSASAGGWRALMGHWGQGKDLPVSVRGGKAFCGTLMTRQGPASGCIGLESTYGTLGTGERSASECQGLQSTHGTFGTEGPQSRCWRATPGTLGTGEGPASGCWGPQSTQGTVGTEEGAGEEHPRGSLTTTEQEVLSSRYRSCPTASSTMVTLSWDNTTQQDGGFCRPAGHQCHPLRPAGSGDSGEGTHRGPRASCAASGRQCWWPGRSGGRR